LVLSLLFLLCRAFAEFRLIKRFSFKQKCSFELAKVTLKSAKFLEFSQKITDFAKNQAKVRKNCVFYVVKIAKISKITQKVKCAGAD